MLTKLAFYTVLGKPLIVWIGMLTLLIFFATASIPILNRKRLTKIPMKWHIRLAILSLSLAVFHAILGINLF